MCKKGENIIVGISIGDMNGIGPEVILKSLEDVRMMELCTPVIFANAKLVSFIKKSVGCTLSIHAIEAIDQIQLGKINVLNIWKEGVNLDMGKLDEKVGKYAIKSFIAATEALKNNEIDVLVTAPINKYNIQSEDFNFPGHTDYLNQELEGNALMLMVTDNLRVGLLTDHLPLNEVAKSITPQLIKQKIKTINQSLIQDFNVIRPKIAVLGLNPHSGDNGVIGKEEIETIIPTVKELLNDGYIVSGPFSADAFFGSEQHYNYDAVVACYHDQGLIPFKAISFGEGINYTAGLDKIRTSPDHGTAYDIAGKNTANFTSFKEAIYTALDIYKNRTAYLKSIEAPLYGAKKN